MLTSTLAAQLFGLPSGMELIVIFAVVLLLFGGAKLPQLARSMGQALRTFREETTKLKREVELAAREEDERAKQAQTPSTPKNQR